MPSPKPLLDLIAKYKNAVERMPSGKYVVSSHLAPSGNDLPELERRSFEIREGLRAAPSETVERRMGKLFSMFPSTSNMSGDKAKAVVDAYAGVLSPFPVWAIDKACQRIIASGAKWLPSAPEIRKMVDTECKFAFDEAESLQIVLTAEPYEPRLQTYRDRMVAGFRQLRALLDKTNNAWRKTPEEAERDILNQFSHLQGDLSVGPGLRALNEATV
jgi:hypothetical protein